MATQARILSVAPVSALGAQRNLPARALIPFSGIPCSGGSRVVPALAGHSFKGGVPLIVWRNSGQKKLEQKATSLTVKCEQSTKGGNGVDVWLGRLAMIGFAAAITTEVATGRGLLENFGLITPLPTVALGVTGLVGVLTAFFIFQSASRE
ncbi:stress enhanced protein 1 [Wolffia australiana]